MSASYWIAAANTAFFLRNPPLALKLDPPLLHCHRWHARPAQNRTQENWLRWRKSGTTDPTNTSSEHLSEPIVEISVPTVLPVSTTYLAAPSTGRILQLYQLFRSQQLPEPSSTTFLCVPTLRPSQVARILSPPIRIQHPPQRATTSLKPPCGDLPANRIRAGQSANFLWEFKSSNCCVTEPWCSRSVCDGLTAAFHWVGSRGAGGGVGEGFASNDPKDAPPKGGFFGGLAAV
ncbi:hypothetical protein HUJ04_001086 [Dendroctonus ponderosae]|nr:hypothetical protein HUJ04_001086 [Dendroctonus ponderosae]